MCFNQRHKNAIMTAVHDCCSCCCWLVAWCCQGDFLHNMLQQQRAIINCMAVNEDGVLASGGDNGSIWFWDWKSGNVFQQQDTIVQPGSLDSEAGIYACSYDISGSRFVTCEADKTIKMWKEDEGATPETHPIVFKPPKDIRRF
jgi:pleiotropic regulator 1